MAEPYVQGQVRRHFVEHDQVDGLYTLKAHRVTEQTKGEVSIVGGGARTVQPGEILVETERPGTYDVYDAAAFDEMGLDPVTEQLDLGQDEDTTEPEPVFNPEEHTAAEVRRYLRNPLLDATERDRVVVAERESRNRPSAIPPGM